MKSTRQKIEQCAGLVGTKDVTAWESQFLEDIVERVKEYGDGHSHPLSEKQMAVLDRIYEKHFA